MRRTLGRIIASLLVTAPVVGGAGIGQLQIQGDLNRYETRYGTPENRSLDESPDSWPRDQSIRTAGHLTRSSQLQARQTGDEQEARPSQTVYELYGKYRLVLDPMPEIAHRVAVDAPTWLGREVEVVGFFARSDGIAFGSGGVSSPSFRIWRVLVLPEREDDGFDAPRSSLDALVMDTVAAAGRVVTVTGTFRGGNLLDDLPRDSRRHAEDWVLSDGPFSIWVTGKKPEGDGFSLGLRSRSDLRWELAVQGKVEVDDGFIYLRAERIRLVGPARDVPE